MFASGRKSSFRRLFTALVVSGVLGTGLVFAQAQRPATDVEEAADSPRKCHPVLLERLAEEQGPVKTWVFFADKGVPPGAARAAALREVAVSYNPRAVQRRLLRGQNAVRGGELFDEHDLPVALGYTDAVIASGARLHITSRWLNAISVWATREQCERIAALPFVDRLEAVARARPNRTYDTVEESPGPFPSDRGGRTLDYGAATSQLNQMNLIALHEAGFTGSGVIIGVLDTGFHRTHEAFHNPMHPLEVVAEHDFVNNDGNTDIEPSDPVGQADHGAMVLGCLAAYKPGSLVGGAYDASFILCKTEDISQEVPAEEDNYVAGLEFIEANGGDMSTASLIYLDWYTQAQLDGQTAVTTIAVNISTANGVHHCNGAGNEGNDLDPATSRLGAPADAFQGITCGAVDPAGGIGYFSSDGPTADGRVKPELLARGVQTWTISRSNNNGYVSDWGTSFATPLVASAVACLIQARPYQTADSLRARMFETADYFVAHGTYDPLFVRGYGIVNALAAGRVCDLGRISLDRGQYACTSTAYIVVQDCGRNADPNLADTVPVVVTSTSEPAGEIVVLTETAPNTGRFEGSLSLHTANAPCVLWVAPGDAVAATYVDADEIPEEQIAVTATATIDCVGPVTSDVWALVTGATSATISFASDEPASGTVHYGLSHDALVQTASGSLSATPRVDLTGLLAGRTYFFKLDASDEAGNTTSDSSCRLFSLDPPQRVYFWPLNMDPGWPRNGDWSFGQPIGQGGTLHGFPDPTSGATGTRVVGVNLFGDYSTGVGGPYYIVLGPIDLTFRANVSLTFQRWLNTDREPYVSATIDASNDAVNWTPVWSNGSSVITDSAWALQTLDISSVAADARTMYIRWGYRIYSGAAAYSGWNIDDVAIWASLPQSWVAADVNCDGVLNFGDINPFVLALTGQASYESAFPNCRWQNGDVNGDGQVDFADINGFVALLISA